MVVVLGELAGVGHVFTHDLLECHIVPVDGGLDLVGGRVGQVLDAVLVFFVRRVEDPLEFVGVIGGDGQIVQCHGRPLTVMVRWCRHHGR